MRPEQLDIKALKRRMKKLDREKIPFVYIKENDKGFLIVRNLLRNFIIRDASLVQKSFDKNFSEHLDQIEEWFSDAGILFFIAGRSNPAGDEEFNATLLGLVSNMLNSFASATLLVRAGQPDQSLIVLRQAIEIASTIIHLVGDPKNKAYHEFKSGTYKSTKSISQATKAIPILAEFWGFLSNNFVHITDFHAQIRAVRPYSADSEAVKLVLQNLKMAIWIVYLASEIAFPAAMKYNRYWKRCVVDGRDAVAFEPNEEETKRYTSFLGLADGDEIEVDLKHMEDDEAENGE